MQSNDNPYQPPETPHRKSPVRYVLFAFMAVGFIFVLMLLAVPSIQRARPAAIRPSCSNHLHQIAIAIHNYESEYKTLPPAYTTDAQGKPLHSWRTLLLPYMDEKELYAAIDLNEPWDSPKNLQAAMRMPACFHCTSSTLSAPLTTYQVIVDPEAMFTAEGPCKFKDVKDGLMMTILVAEVTEKEAVHWMRPEDTSLHSFLDARQRHSSHPGGRHILLGDAAVRFLSTDVSERDLRALITKNGGESIPADLLE